MKIEFHYKLKDEIKIKNINTVGIVIGYYYGEMGVQYQVAYFVDGERKLAYLFPEEIKILDGKENVGFIK